MVNSENSTILPVLEQQMATASALAAVLLINENQTIQVGELGPRDVNLVEAALKRYWPDLRHSSLNRMVGMALEQQFVFLYAKHLPLGTGLLGLVFPLKTPLIRLRQDMTHFIQALEVLEPAPDWVERRSEPFSQFAAPLSPESTADGQDGQKGVTDDQRKVEESNLLKQPLDLSEDKNQAAFEAQLLRQSRLAEEAHQEDETGEVAEPRSWQALEALSWQTTSPDLNEEETPSDPAGPSDWNPWATSERQGEDLPNIFQANYDRPEPVHETSWQTDENAIDEREDPLFPRGNFEEDSPYNPNWTPVNDPTPVSDVTIYLVPREGRHFLVGELAQMLRRWMPEICQTYGWQLDRLSVRPDYLKWTLNDFPETLMQELLQTVRDETSQRVFQVFPNMRPDPLMVDFWAPGYLVDTQNQEFSTQAVMTRVAIGRFSAG